MTRRLALVGIVAGFVLTVAIIVVMFVSTGSVQKDAVPTAPTVAQLDDGVPAGWTAPLSGELAVRNGCLVLTIDGADRFAVWPAGATKQGDTIALKAGRTLAADATVSGTGALVTRASLLAYSDQYEQYLSDMTTRCIPDTHAAQPIAVLVHVDAG